MKKFMTWVKEEVETHNSTPEEPFVWSPVDMIDGDEAERKGLSLAWHFFLFKKRNFPFPMLFVVELGLSSIGSVVVKFPLE
jgi:hypothetical protein